jgi:hypothetical protein
MDPSMKYIKSTFMTRMESIYKNGTKAKKETIVGPSGEKTMLRHTTEKNANCTNIMEWMEESKRNRMKAMDGR